MRANDLLIIFIIYVGLFAGRSLGQNQKSPNLQQTQLNPFGSIYEFFFCFPNPCQNGATCVPAGFGEILGGYFGSSVPYICICPRIISSQLHIF